MGYTKSFLLLGLLFAIVLVISSEVSARELAEAAQTRYPKDTKMQGTQIVGYPNEEAVQGIDKSLKFPNGGLSHIKTYIEMYRIGFQVPLHYPRYTKVGYEKMEEWKVDMLLMEYGLNFKGTLDGKQHPQK